MNLVLDTNIVISGLITPNGTISKLILKDLRKCKLVSPFYLFDEILSKFEKLKKLTNLKDHELKELMYHFVKRIDFIDDDLIYDEYQQQAYQLVKDVDKKDLLFVALSLQTGFTLWTGDKKLVRGLTKKGFSDLITTPELVDREVRETLTLLITRLVS